MSYINPFNLPTLIKSIPKLLYLHIQCMKTHNLIDGSSELIIWLLAGLVKSSHRIHMFGIAYDRLVYDSKLK